VAALGGLLFGFDTGIISGAILFISNEYQLTPWMNGAVVGAVLFGAFLGSAISGRSADTLGRRRLLIFTAVIFVVGTVMASIASGITMLIWGRIVVGIAIGISSFVAPLYISEVAPPHWRGALVSLNQLMITVGIVLSYTINYVFAIHGEWRWMFITGVIPAILLLFGMIFLPDSPRWMMSRGLRDQARTILCKVRSTSNVDQELNEIASSLSHQRGHWRTLFEPWLYPAIIVAVGLAFFQQVTGINTIIYYAPTIFKLAGIGSDIAAILATLGVGVVNVLFTIIALPLIDRWGRRPLLLVGLAGMAVALLALGMAFHDEAHTAMMKWIALSSMVLYIACFAMSLGPIMWLIISEIFPLKIRGLASSLAIAASWGFNLIVAVSFLSLIKWLHPFGTFLLYGLLSIWGWLFVYYKVPETKDVSLELIEEHLREGRSARQLGQEN